MPWGLSLCTHSLSSSARPPGARSTTPRQSRGWVDPDLSSKHHSYLRYLGFQLPLFLGQSTLEDVDLEMQQENGG